VVADSLLDRLKLEHFQGLIDKGINLYKKAGRTRNPDLYFTSRYYFKQAQEFESDNRQIVDYLHRIKAKTFSVLDYREGVSMAIAGYKQERKATVVNLTIKNYTANPVQIKLGNFTLVDVNGNSYRFNEQEMQKRELFGETPVKNTVLNPENPSVSGIVAFDAPPDIKIAYVNYQINGNSYARKYFP
jgi:hypothetical protein